MRFLWRLFRRILMFFGVLFILEIGVLLWFWSADPYHLKQFIIPVSLPRQTATSTDATATSTDKNPLLSADQEKALETFGVDPSALPTSVTPSMQDCLVQAVGEQRAKEILAGATPSALDFIKARSCLAQ